MTRFRVSRACVCRQRCPNPDADPHPVCVGRPPAPAWREPFQGPPLQELEAHRRKNRASIRRCGTANASQRSESDRTDLKEGEGEVAMTMQSRAAQKITITRAMLAKAARYNETWKELYVAIQTHLRVEIEPNIQTETRARAQHAA